MGVYLLINKECIWLSGLACHEMNELLLPAWVLSLQKRKEIVSYIYIYIYIITLLLIIYWIFFKGFLVINIIQYQ